MNKEEYTILAIAWSAVRSVLDHVGYTTNIKKAWPKNKEVIRKEIRKKINNEVRLREYTFIEERAKRCLEVPINPAQFNYRPINDLFAGKCSELSYVLYVLIELCEFPFLKKNLYLSIYELSDHVFCLFHTGAVPEFSKDIKDFFYQIGMSGHTAVFADPWLSCACLVKPENTRIVLDQARDFGVASFYGGVITKTPSAPTILLKYTEEQITLPEGLDLKDYQNIFYSMKEYFYTYLKTDLEYIQFRRELPICRKMDFSSYENKLNDKFELPYYPGINQPGVFDSEISLCSLFEKFINNIKSYAVVEEQKRLIEEITATYSDIKSALKDLSFIVSQDVSSFYLSSPLSKMAEFLNMSEYSRLKAIMGFEDKQLARQRDIRCFAVNGYSLYLIPIQDQDAMHKKLEQNFAALLKQYK